MKTKVLSIASMLLTSVFLINGCSKSSSVSLKALKSEDVHTFEVGNHQVTIETQSFSVAKDDSGPAKIIVYTGEDKTVIDSYFSQDLISDMRPAYISWQDVDEYEGQDLLIWKPINNSKFTTSNYISNTDGKLHTLSIPLTLEDKAFDFISINEVK